MAEKKYITLEDGMGERYRIPEDKVQRAMETFAEMKRLAEKAVSEGIPAKPHRYDLRIVKDEK